VTVAEAARRWVAAKKAERKAAAQLKASGQVLKDHFRKTGRHTYKDQISYAVATRRTLDTEKVKAELGDRLPKFERVSEVETLSLL
jgi:hypothetical protein